MLGKKDDELDSLQREAQGEERAEAQAEKAKDDQYIEDTERRLRRLFANLEQLPAPFDFDASEQGQLAEVWAPICKDFEVAGDAPVWFKWGVAGVTTAMIAAPKVIAAQAMAAAANAQDVTPEQASAEPQAGEGSPDGEA